MKTRKEKIQMLNALKSGKINPSEYIDLNDDRPYQPAKMYIQDDENPELFRCGKDGELMRYSDIKEETKKYRSSSRITGIFIISKPIPDKDEVGTIRLDFKNAE